MEPVVAGESTSSYQFDFRNNLIRYLTASASDLNEEHLTEHRRGGFATPLWG
jgi:hypothetical protein